MYKATNLVHLQLCHYGYKIIQAPYLNKAASIKRLLKTIHFYVRNYFKNIWW